MGYLTTTTTPLTGAHAVARTARLAATIGSALGERPFELVFWDGVRVPATAPGPTVSVHSPRAIGHLLRAPGQLGLVRAYVDGLVDADDLDAVVALGDWRPPAFGVTARSRVVAAAISAGGRHARPQRAPTGELRPHGRVHSRGRDARSVRHHYDLPGEFYAQFLDESMTYSCALFRDGARTLEAAQEAKHELVCRKLCLRAGDRVLDIGCGWGAFALHAAARHGVHVTAITLSEPQAEIARSRAAAAGLSGRVDVQVMDYRDVGPASFDAVVSVGMIEHVGNTELDAYAQMIASALAPGGRVLNHGIARVPAGEHQPAVFTRRYVFPDGELPRISRVLDAFERAGLESRHVEDLRADYVRTLEQWIERLDANADRAAQLVGPERLRVWRLYLRGARHGFAVGLTSVYQTVLSAQDNRIRAHQPGGHRRDRGLK